MANTKGYRWVKGIHKATAQDELADLTFEITRNETTTGLDDKFSYRCRSTNGKLLFDRKINFGIAVAVINHWPGEVMIQETDNGVTRRG